MAGDLRGEGTPTQRAETDGADARRADEVPKRALADVLDELAETHQLRHEEERGSGSEVRIFDPRSGNHATVGSVVLKRPAADDASRAREVVEQLVACRAAATGAGVQPIAAEPLVWGEDPAFVLYRYLDGALLSDEIKRVLTADPSGRARVLALARQAGEVIARYHEAVDASAEAPSIVFERIPARSRYLRFAGVHGGTPPSVVRSFIDPEAHNMVLDPSGTLMLIDFPEEHRVAPPGRDLGVLAFFLVRQSRGAGDGAIRRLGSRTVVPAVVAGYGAARDLPPELRHAIEADAHAYFGVRAMDRVARDCRRVVKTVRGRGEGSAGLPRPLRTVRLTGWMFESLLLSRVMRLRRRG